MKADFCKLFKTHFLSILISVASQGSLIYSAVILISASALLISEKAPPCKLIETTYFLSNAFLENSGLMFQVAQEMLERKKRGLLLAVMISKG